MKSPSKYFVFFNTKEKSSPEIENVRQDILMILLIIFSVIGLPATIAGSIQAYLHGRWVFSMIYIGTYLAILITTCLSQRLSNNLKALIFLISVFTVAIVIMVRTGLSGVSIELLIAVCILSALLFTARAGMLIIGISIIAIILIGSGLLFGFIGIEPDHITYSKTALTWIASGLIFSIVTISLVMSIQLLIARLEESLVMLEGNAEDLERSVQSLETEVSSRKETESALRHSEEKFRNLAELLPETIFEMDAAGNLTFVNQRAFDNFRYTREDFSRGVNGMDMIAPEDRSRADEHVQRVLKGEDLGLTEYTAIRKDGSTFPAIFHSTVVLHEDRPVGLRGFIIDITERKRLENRLKQAEKMEAVGTLAGGVAHDLNNVLAGIVSYPDLLLMELSEDSPLREPIITIQNSGIKAAAIVQDLLTLARRGVAHNEVVNLNTIITDQLKSPEYKKLRSFHPKVQVEVDLNKDLLNIQGSPIHLSKTIMNIISNAAEAMPAGGKIRISTENRYVDRPIHGYDDIAQGDYIMLVISDTGVGISSEIRERIFEPFFTKKVMERSGTGLGMAVVWGTVKDHKGYIDIESTEGKGTTFTLYFPTTREEIDKNETLVAMQDYVGRGESILVVDDIEEQRELANGMLTKMGYSVKTVSSGEEAIDFLRNNLVDLLVLDMIMEPGIDGLDTYRQILGIHPNQRAIIASGYSETGRVKEAQRLGAGQYIKKPYTIQNISIAVRTELDR